MIIQIIFLFTMLEMLLLFPFIYVAMWNKMPFFLSFFCIQVSRPYKQAELEIIFGEGVSKLVCDLLNFLCKFPKYTIPG